MTEVRIPRNAGSFPASIYVVQVNLVIPAAVTTVTHTTAEDWNGVVMRVEIDDATLNDAADLVAYDATTLTTPNYFINVQNITGEKTLFPLIAATDNAGSAIAGQYVQPVVAGKLTFVLSSATAGDSLIVRVYIMG